MGTGKDPGGSELPDTTTSFSDGGAGMEDDNESIPDLSEELNELPDLDADLDAMFNDNTSNDSFAAGEHLKSLTIHQQL